MDAARDGAGRGERRGGEGRGRRTGMLGATEKLGAAMRWLWRPVGLQAALLRAGGAGFRTEARTASGSPREAGELQGELDRFGGVSVHLARHRALHGLDAAAFRRLLQGKCGSRAPETRAERAGSEVKAERTPSERFNSCDLEVPSAVSGSKPGYSPLVLLRVRSS